MILIYIKLVQIQFMFKYLQDFHLVQCLHFIQRLLEVHIFTFDPLSSPSLNTSDLITFGCFDSNRDSEYDSYFYKIFDVNNGISSYDFLLNNCK